jgi:hypothetical protein
MLEDVWVKLLDAGEKKFGKRRLREGGRCYSSPGTRYLQVGGRWEGTWQLEGSRWVPSPGEFFLKKKNQKRF